MAQAAGPVQCADSQPQFLHGARNLLSQHDSDPRILGCFLRGGHAWPLVVCHCVWCRPADCKVARRTY